MIDSAEISVLVSGPIYGSSSSPENEQWTRRALESIRMHLPASEIILSTWIGSDTQGLSYDILIVNEDPGFLVSDKINSMLGNINRQIFATKYGSRAANRKYLLKLRCDLILTGINFLNYFGKYQHRCDYLKFLEERVIISSHVTQNPRKNPVPLNPSDWFQFGYTHDVVNIYNIPMMPPFDGKNVLYCYQYTPEQYIWVSFLKKHFDFDFTYANDFNEFTALLTEISFANNLVVVDPAEINIYSCKYASNHYSDEINMSHTDWYHLYQLCCCQS